MKIEVHLSIGYPGAEQDDVIEVDDDATPEEIGAEVELWANEYIEYWWEPVKEGDA